MKVWPSTKLGDILEVLHGYAFPSAEMSENLNGNPIIVSIGNFNYSGGFRFNSTRTREFVGTYPEQFNLNAGDLLVAMTCQTPGGEILGLPGFVPDDGKTYLHNQRIGLVKTRPQFLDKRFAFYLFLSKEVNRQLVATASGTKILHTAPSRIANVEINLPPLVEQQAIAAILGALDDKIAVNDRVISCSYELIIATWRAVASKATQMVTFSMLADLDKGVSYKGSGLGSGEPLVNLGNFGTDGRFKTEKLKYYSGEVRDRHWVRDGDLVIANTDLTQRREILGLPAIVQTDASRALFTHHVFAVRPRDTHNDDLLWLYGALRDTAFRERAVTFASGTTVAALPRDAVLTHELPFPSAHNRRNWSATSGTLIKAISARTRENRALNRLRDALLPKLISGEIRVRDAEKVVEEAV